MFRVMVMLLVAATSALAPFPAEADSNSFIDDDNSRYEPFIERANAEGLINGCNPPANDRACPDQSLTRGDLAVILARAIAAPAPEQDHFTDDDGHRAEGAINALMDAGVGMSCGGDRYCPDRLITRGEMATLMVRTLGAPKTTISDGFVDLGETKHAEALTALAGSGSLLPCDPPVNRRLCPTATVSRGEATFAVVTSMGLGPARTASTDEKLEPLGFGDGFHHLSLWDGRTPSARNNVSMTSGYRESGLRVEIPKGSHFGSDFHLHLEDAAARVPERLFFRYYLKLDSDWRTTTAGKLPGFSGVYGSTGKGGFRSQPSQPGWSARMMFYPNNSGDGRVGLGYYVYHLGQERRYGDGLRWNEAGKLRPGEWYCLEGEIELNTPGIADGALRAWVDETPALDVSGLEFRRPSEPQIKIESFWFNVYYGGKPVPSRDLGLTIDEVMVDTERIGCGEGQGLATPLHADVDGDGYQDRIRWDRCAGGPCFVVDRATWQGRKTSQQSGDGAWFDLDTHRYGMAAGDVDGDGLADIVYRGRCDGSQACWRVHAGHGGMRIGENWGVGGRFSPSTSSLLLGDWNGDGRDDLAHVGVCGDGDRPCWRVHLSSGTEFAPAADWGPPPPPGMTSPFTVDLTNDGRDDLIFEAPCEESVCWFTQMSAHETFGQPTVLGPVLEAADNARWIDFDGDGVTDLVSYLNTETASWVEVRYFRDGRFGPPRRLASFTDPIEGLAIRRQGPTAPVQAIVPLRCDEASACLRTLMSPSPDRLVDADRFRDVRWSRPGAPQIT